MTMVSPQAHTDFRNQRFKKKGPLIQMGTGPRIAGINDIGGGNLKSGKSGKPLVRVKPRLYQ